MVGDFAIRCSSLRKEFGQKVAVRGLDLEVKRGQVFGFLGPNGAGKTTSIKMFLSLVFPTSGWVEILGSSPRQPEARNKTGFLPEHFRFHDWLTAEEFLKVHGQLYRIQPSALDRQVNVLLEQVGLEAFSRQQLRTFSKGMLQRIGLAQALINNPELVFLDEPTSGLDPVGRRLVRDIIRSLRDRGTTVFLNSHLLSEVEITCDEVAFIKYGEVLRISELSRLVDGETTLTVRLRNFTAESLIGLEKWGKDIRLDGESLHMVVDREESLPNVNRYLIDHGADIFSFTPQKMSLEDLFIQIVGTDGGL